MNLSALWGKFACGIVSGDWEVAWEDLQKLREAIDTKVYSSNPH